MRKSSDWSEGKWLGSVTWRAWTWKRNRLSSETGRQVMGIGFGMDRGEHAVPTSGWWRAYLGPNCRQCRDIKFICWDRIGSEGAWWMCGKSLRELQRAVTLSKWKHWQELLRTQQRPETNCLQCPWFARWCSSSSREFTLLSMGAEEAGRKTLQFKGAKHFVARVRVRTDLISCYPST